MILFILKRIFYFILAVPVVIWLSLLLFQASPIDPVEKLMDYDEIHSDYDIYTANYINVAKKHHLNLPIFYFSVSTSLYSSDFYDIVLPEKKYFYKRLLQGGWKYKEVEDLLEIFKGFKPKIDESIGFTQMEKSLLNNPYSIKNKDKLGELLERIQLNLKDESIIQKIDNLNIQAGKNRFFQKLIPKIHWHGSSNQFHQNIIKFISLDFGRSIFDGQLVSKKILSALAITLFLIFFSVITVFPVGIWLGKRMTVMNSGGLKVIESILLFFSSIPPFWIATILLVFFTTPEYGKIFHIFPAVESFGFRTDRSALHNIINNLNQFILPVLSIFLADLAIVMRQTNQLLKEQSQKTYVTTAKMKGLTQNEIVNKHMFLNTKTQILTLISSGITGAFAGALVVEYIFNIPGIGNLLLSSVKSGDIPVIMGMILFLYFIASLIFLLTDLLYKKIDPRINLNL